MSEALSEEFQKIVDGMNEPCDLLVPGEPPEWLDRELFEIGRRFYYDNCLGVLFGNFRCLIVGMAVKNLCEVLVLTRRSETPQKAQHRYRATGSFISKWYDELPWTESGHQLFEVVNGYHKSAADQFRSLTRSERQKKAKEILDAIPGNERVPDHPLDDVLLENVRILRDTKFKDVKFHIFERYLKSDTLFSQLDMAMVQAAFIGSIAVFPDRFGAAKSTTIELEGFIHLWRVIGKDYLMFTSLVLHSNLLNH